MAERTARIGKGKGPEVSPVLAATLISLLIGGLIGYTIRYFQVGYFTTAAVPDDMRSGRALGFGGPRGGSGGGGGGAGRSGPEPTPGGGGQGGVSVPSSVATEPVISALREQASDAQLSADTQQQLITLADALQAASNSSQPPRPSGQPAQQQQPQAGDPRP
jgi:hypothetical protein